MVDRYECERVHGLRSWVASFFRDFHQKSPHTPSLPPKRNFLPLSPHVPPNLNPVSNPSHLLCDTPAGRETVMFVEGPRIQIPRLLGSHLLRAACICCFCRPATAQAQQRLLQPSTLRQRRRPLAQRRLPPLRPQPPAAVGVKEGAGRWASQTPWPPSPSLIPACCDAAFCLTRSGTWIRMRDGTWILVGRRESRVLRQKLSLSVRGRRRGCRSGSGAG